MATAEEGVIICGMVRNTTLAFLLLVAFAAPIAAQAPDGRRLGTGLAQCGQMFARISLQREHADVGSAHGW